MKSTHRGMDQASLDLAYNNVQAELHYQAIMSHFKAQGDAFYRTAKAGRHGAPGAATRHCRGAASVRLSPRTAHSHTGLLGRGLTESLRD
jgi:hypothetical protein